MATVRQALNIAQPNDLPDMLRKVGLGDIFAGLVPTRVVRTGLTSSATQVEPGPGTVLFVESSAGAQKVILTKPDATPGAGDVVVTYDANGVATLVFNAAVTAYTIVRLGWTARLGEILAADAGACY